jgi:isoleucyl-tRNA synthetase
LKQVENQKEQFKTFQLLADDGDHYVTLNKSFEAKQLTIFKDMILKDLIYKGLKPVF